MFDAKKKAYLENRESLKQKMLASGPNSLIEVTPGELHIVLSGAMDGLMEEVEKQLAKQADQRKTRIDENRRAGRHPMDGLSREADTINGEPDHKAHLDRQVKREVTFEEAVKPLMAWLSDNHHPHVQAIVSATTAELVEGLKSFNSFEFVKD